MRVTVHNRGGRRPPRCTCCRSCGSATPGPGHGWLPEDRGCCTGSGRRAIEAHHAELGTYHLHADGEPHELLFCDNESNPPRLLGRHLRARGYFKDAFHELRRRRPRRSGQSGQRGHQGRGVAIAVRCPPVASGADPAAADAARH